MVKPTLSNVLLFCLPLVTLSNAQWGSGGGGGNGGGGGSGGKDSSSSSMDTASMTTAAPTMTASSSSATQSVDVGNGGFVYSPDTLHASPGDKIEFHFYPGNHSVVQAAFNKPCEPMSTTSFFSGFVPALNGESSTIFTLTVNDTNPIWFYCGQVSHCSIGMVGVINPPSSGPDTLAAFKHAASQTTSSGVPAQPQGGILSTEKESSGSSTTTPSGSSPTMSASSSMSASASPTSSSTGEAGRSHFSDLSFLFLLSFVLAMFMM